jgi:hypothetical protein
MLMCGVAQAYVGVDVCDSHFGKIYNKCVSHPNQIVSDKKSTEVGIGTDLLFYEGAYGDVLNEVTGEYRYDWANAEHQAYAVARIRVKDLVTKLRGLLNR